MRLELGDLLEALIAVGELDEAEDILATWEAARRRARPGLGARDPRPLPRAAARGARRSRGRVRELRARARRARPQHRSVPPRADAARARHERSGARSSAAPPARRSRTRSRASNGSARRSGPSRRAPSWRASAGARPRGGELTEAERRIARTRRRRQHEPRGRGRPLPHRALRRDGADARLSQARRPLPRRARAPARRKQLRFPAFAAARANVKTSSHELQRPRLQGGQQCESESSVAVTAALPRCWPSPALCGREWSIRARRRAPGLGPVPQRRRGHGSWLRVGLRERCREPDHHRLRDRRTPRPERWGTTTSTRS